MQTSEIDVAECRFLTAPEACINCRLVEELHNCELQLFGNRAGLLSLANILLWFVANDWRREFLSFGSLEFMHVEGELAVTMRLADASPENSHGILSRLDGRKSLEWAITPEGLQQVALWLHRLVSRPAHEYDRLLTSEGSACGVHVRITDAAKWLEQGVS